MQSYSCQGVCQSHRRPSTSIAPILHVPHSEIPVFLYKNVSIVLSSVSCAISQSMRSSKESLCVLHSPALTFRMMSVSSRDSYRTNPEIANANQFSIPPYSSSGHLFLAFLCPTCPSVPFLSTPCVYLFTSTPSSLPQMHSDPV